MSDKPIGTIGYNPVRGNKVLDVPEKIARLDKPIQKTHSLLYDLSGKHKF